jgi:cystathionine gamma-synthase
MAASMSDNDTRSPETIAAHALYSVEEVNGSVVPPLHTATTFARDHDYQLRGKHLYSRYGNPTIDQAQEIISRLENGAGAMLYASGLAGISGLFETLKGGSHVVAPEIMYWGTRDLMNRMAGKGRITASYVDPTDLDTLKAAIIPGKTEMVWIETPVNPVWDVVDIKAVAEIAHAAGAELAVDSTSASPAVTRPLDHDADIVFHSITKYLNGHSDVLGGVLVTARDDERWAEARHTRDVTGAILAPFEAWLLIRGMRTLYVRVNKAAETALAIARFLEHHPKVEKVLYPGLQSHPGHEIARRQMDGFGGMMSMCVKGGLAETGRVIRALKIFLPATSLGGVESLAEHRKVIEGGKSPVPDNLIRLSIGIEAKDDLIADLDQALAKA